MTISAIVPAAGCGARAALNGNKILAPLLDGKSVLFWTLSALCAASYGQVDGQDELLEIIVVARPEEFVFIDEVFSQLKTATAISVIAGGATRQDSVFEGVQAARGELILVHDAARPCVSPSVIRRTVEAARTGGAAIAALPAIDTVKRADKGGNIAQTLDRSEIWLAQTPQVFRRDWFLAALLSTKNEGFQGTDCASIMERAGHKIALVEGDTGNFKITYATDLERAASFLKARFQL